MEFHEVFTRLRQQAGLSQSEVAERLFVTRQAVSRWERGVGYPDITLLEPLAGQLGVTVLDILRGEKTFPDKMTGEETEQTVAETVRLAAVQRRQAVRRVILLAIVMLIGAAMLIWGILWWTSQQSALKIIAGADGPSAVFVAWRVEPMLPVAVSAAGAVLILASLLIYRWRK